MAFLYRTRRLGGALIVAAIVITSILLRPEAYHTAPADPADRQQAGQSIDVLDMLSVKGRAPKTGYARDQFGSGWRVKDGCDTRNIILHRDLKPDVVDEKCHVTRGTLNDPYTGKMIQFQRGSRSSQAVQIDHVVALSNAWQTGAQLLSRATREDFANDPLNLLAVDGPANQQKSDGDAATWLPSNKPYRCRYVERQITIKQKYKLWVTTAEKAAMARVLGSCTS